MAKLHHRWWNFFIYLIALYSRSSPRIINLDSLWVKVRDFQSGGYAFAPSRSLSLCILTCNFFSSYYYLFCPASFRETCQGLNFPLNGLRAQSRVSPVVGLLRTFRLWTGMFRDGRYMIIFILLGVISVLICRKNISFINTLNVADNLFTLLTVKYMFTDFCLCGE
jgi:hypothetical protein